jgi:O-antigen ligase
MRAGFDFTGGAPPTFVSNPGRPSTLVYREESRYGTGRPSLLRNKLEWLFDGPGPLSMPYALAALFYFAILTLWVPAEWPVTVFQLGIFLLAILALIKSQAQSARPFPEPRPPFPGPLPLIPLLLAPLYGLTQLLTHRTAYAFDTANATVRWAAFLATFLTGALIFRDSSSRRWFRSAMLWFAFLVSVLATVQTFTSHGRVFWLFPTGVTDYLMGPILSRNHYAAFIEIALPIALYEALRDRPNPLLYSLMAAAMYASVIASASRAGTVLATAEVLTVLLLMLARGRASGRAAFASLGQMLILFAVFTAIVGPQTVWSRLWAPDPLLIRRELNISSLHMIAAHPWFGVGLGAWPTVYQSYAVIDVGAFANQAHNDWLQWTAEGGIPFGVLLSLLFFWSLRPAFRSIWGIGIIAVFLHALVDYPFSRPALGSWPFLIMAMLSARKMPVIKS